MSDLTAQIAAFLAKYPDDAELTWAETRAAQRRRVDPALRVIADDIVDAAEVRSSLGRRP